LESFFKAIVPQPNPLKEIPAGLVRKNLLDQFSGAFNRRSFDFVQKTDFAQDNRYEGSYEPCKGDPSLHSG